MKQRSCCVRLRQELASGDGGRPSQSAALAVFASLYFVWTGIRRDDGRQQHFFVVSKLKSPLTLDTAWQAAADETRSAHLGRLEQPVMYSDFFRKFYFGPLTRKQSQTGL